MLASIRWDLRSVSSLRIIASRSPLRPDYGRSGRIDADRFDLLEAQCFHFLVVFSMRCLEAVTLGSVQLTSVA